MYVSTRLMLYTEAFSCRHSVLLSESGFTGFTDFQDDRYALRETGSPEASGPISKQVA